MLIYPVGYEGVLFFSDTPFRVPSDQRGGGPLQPASFCNFRIFLQNLYFVNIYVHTYPREYIDPTVDVVICDGARYSFFKLNTLVLMLFRVFRLSGSVYCFLIFFNLNFFLKNK